MKGVILSSYIIILISILSIDIHSQQDLNPEQIYKKVNDAVVIVLTYNEDNKLMNQGSGVVVTDKGVIITNYHVMKNASKVNVMHGDMVFKNVKIVGGNEENDILFLLIKNDSLSVIETPDSLDVKIGQKVYAIGSPLGYENSISEGIVSGYRKFDTINLIQITASISPGSSGGAVVNSKGQLIGISTYTVTEGQNINFAIPVKEIFKTKITPFKSVVTVTKEKKDDEIKKIEEPKIERKDIYHNPKAVEFLNKGKELVGIAYDQKNKKDEWTLYQKAIVEFNNAIKNDSTLVEAYYEAGQIYASNFKLNNFKEAIKYFNKVEYYINNTIGDVSTSSSNREIIADIAMYYSFQDENIEDYFTKAIQLYNKALNEYLPQDIPIYSDISDDQINYKIAHIYEELGNNTFKEHNDYFKAHDYFDLALNAANKMLYKYDWLIENIKTDDKVCYQLYIDYEWQAFRIICKGLLKERNIMTDCKPLVVKNILYIYHPKSIIKEKNNIVRLWTKEVNLDEKSEGAKIDYKYLKSLFEFDLKNKKFRVLQQSTQYNDDHITSNSFSNAEWQYVSPETVAETMIENIKLITK